LSFHRQVASDLRCFGINVLSTEVKNWTAEAERNPPFLQSFDSWGKRQNKLVTSEGWKRLQDMGIKEGIVAIPYEKEWGQWGRAYQFLK
jgi:hypothetical protein